MKMIRSVCKGIPVYLQKRNMIYTFYTESAVFQCLFAVFREIYTKMRVKQRKRQANPKKIPAGCPAGICLPFLLFCLEAGVFQLQVEHRSALPARAGQDGGMPGNFRSRHDFIKPDRTVGSEITFDDLFTAAFRADLDISHTDFPFIRCRSCCNASFRCTLPHHSLPHHSGRKCSGSFC